MLLPLLLLLTATEPGHAEQVKGTKKADDSCVCKVNTTMWAFPAQPFEKADQMVQNCGDTLQKLQNQVTQTNGELPKIQAIIKNVTARIEPLKYLDTKGIYNALHLRQLSQDLEEISQMINTAHNDNPSAETQKLTKEVVKVQEEVKNMFKDNVFNLETMREKLRSLHNRVQSCRTIPDDFRSHCYKRIMKNISSPVTTKLNPHSKSYISGAWGREAKRESEDVYWTQPLANSHKYGIQVRLYRSYEDFMASKNHRDENVAPGYTAPNAIQGPGMVLYGGVVYYQCYNEDELCRYDLQSKETKRLKLPNAGINNKFPYCYYSCRDWTDIDLSADEQGLWVIYATESNHGNIVLSRLDTETFNITHTWKTRLFKKSVTNAFMVCGVLYATRYADTYREEVFYAFDTDTGHEDNTLSLPLEKVSAGVASLSYNPIDMKLYMYNDGYLLAYQALF
ncbi:olfactomedin-4-like [Chanos chanos]|uniref:Olfactomedin-4-like n=1 Tax=Chanos chanos TaxID=29144 RepID=A0A6J2VBW2_CHACN|nr:olfactomedin-4-like [Chanos chanos]